MLTRNLLVLKKVLLGMAISWTILIAVLCLIRFNNLPSITVQSADKYVHVTFHFFFTMFWGLYIYLKQNKIQFFQVIGILALSIVYGILIEFLQETLTTTRHADVYDVLANFAGALIASVSLLVIKTKFSKPLNNKSPD